MLGQELPSTIPFKPAERAPTAKELELWNRAQKIAKRVNLLSYILKNQFSNILFTHKFAQANKIAIDEPELPDLEKRMLAALTETEKLKDLMCEVSQLELGVRLSAKGNDLDIIDPETPAVQIDGALGWVIPAVLGAVIVVGIIARWAYLEGEQDEIIARYNGILKRSDIALCGVDPHSKQCQDWENAKSTGGYYKRETIIDSVKSAVSTAGKITGKGLGIGLSLAIPLLAWIYAPRRRKD